MIFAIAIAVLPLKSNSCIENYSLTKRRIRFGKINFKSLNTYIYNIKINLSKEIRLDIITKQVLYTILFNPYIVNII